MCGNIGDRYRLFFGLLQILSLSQQLFSVSSSSSSSSVLSSSSSLSSSRGIVWEHKAAFDDLIFAPSSEYVHKYLHAPTRGACAMACNMHRWCASFNYRQGEGTCLLDSVVVESAADTLPAEGVVHFHAASDWCKETEGFIFYPSEQFCFRVYQEVVTDWHTANSRCKALGLDLVVPDNANQLALLLATVHRTKEFRRKNNYLGIVRPLEEWNTAWPDGVPRFVDVHNNSFGHFLMDPQFWVKNNPNNQKRQQNCVQIDRKRGIKLNDLWCDYNNYYICQRRPSDQ